MRYEDDGFDPTPYDRILSGIHTPKRAAANAEDIDAYRAARENSEIQRDIQEESLSQIDDEMVPKAASAGASMEIAAEEYAQDFEEDFEAADTDFAETDGDIADMNVIDMRVGPVLALFPLYPFKLLIFDLRNHKKMLQ